MNFRLALSLLVAASATTSSFGAGDDCQPISEIICEHDDTRVLCDAIHYTDLEDTVDKRRTTLFAPTDRAFTKLLGAVDYSEVSVQDDDKKKKNLKELLLFHIVLGEQLDEDELFERCEYDEETDMANGDTTYTKCSGYRLYQYGPGNDDDKLPKIIDSDIKACNRGIIQVINGVMLPGDHPDHPVPRPTPAPTKRPTKAPTPAPHPSCDDIIDVICDYDHFRIFCKALERAGLVDDYLYDYHDELTVFAPTDEAFYNLFGDDAWKVLRNMDSHDRENLLLYHFLEDHTLYFDDLHCDERYKMANGDRSTTKCKNSGRKEQKYQVGRDNDYTDWPRIVYEDMEACYGVVHGVTEVLLPRGFYNEHVN